MARLPVPGSDNDIWGDILNEYLGVEHNPDGTLDPNGTIASKADDADVVHNTSDESIDGTKTFTSPVIVATPTIGLHATTKTYVDSAILAGAPDATTTTKGIVQLAGDLSGTTTAPTVPGLAGKEPTIAAGTTAHYWRGDKTFQTLDKTVVGLGNVDNTSDANKPVSTAQQTAIDGKVADAINDGTTTIAPSQNAVFDALALNLKIASNLSDLNNVATARTNLGLVAGGAGDIWVEKAGDTMTGPLDIAVATGTPLVVNTNTLVADASNNRVGVGTASPGTMLSVAGVISAKAGTSTGQIAKVGGTIFSYITDAGNSTTSETDLYTDSIPASTLSTDKDKLAARYGGEMVGSATATRRLRVYFGGTAIFDSGTFAVSAANDWDLEVLIIRVNATVVRFSCRLNITNTTPIVQCSVGELTGLTLSNANILKITGQAAGVGAATNDIVARLGTVEWKPAP